MQPNSLIKSSSPSVLLHVFISFFSKMLLSYDEPSVKKRGEKKKKEKKQKKGQARKPHRTS